MKKDPIYVRMLYLIATNTTLPIHKVHSAGDSFCVSGDRRLRKIKENFEKDGGKNSYTYDPVPLKEYLFDPEFRKWCMGEYLKAHPDLGSQGRTGTIRVQNGLPVETPDNLEDLAPKGICRLCGAKIPEKPKRKNRMYCSPRCRVEGWRRNHYEKENKSHPINE